MELYLHSLHTFMACADTVFLLNVGECAVAMVTCFGLDGPEIESRWGARFSAPVQTCPGAHPTSYTMGTGSFPGVKRPGPRVDHPPPSSAQVKERIELTSTPPLGLRGFLWADLYLYLFRMWVSSHSHPCHLPAEEESPLHGQMAGWTPESFWVLCGGDECIAHVGY